MHICRIAAHDDDPECIANSGICFFKENVAERTGTVKKKKLYDKGKMR